MKENNKGKEILKLLQENYDINTAQDLSSALKDLFKGALQEMMNAEFDSSMGYSKYDKKSEKTNYRNGTTKKNLKSELHAKSAVSRCFKFVFQRVVFVESVKKIFLLLAFCHAV